jgi:hypothetical protein
LCETYLAWQEDWPSDYDNTVGTPWHDAPPQSWELSTGMTDYLHYTTQGVTLYGMTAALNWEASGRNNDPPGTWLSYFYDLAWISQNNSHTILNNDVVSDVATDVVPVVAEVDDKYLPNWHGKTTDGNHLITIVGYDNVHGYYYYTDTCGLSTSCNSFPANSDDNPGTGQPYQISQGQMWNAITAVTEDQRTGITQGDGGWVW